MQCPKLFNNTKWILNLIGWKGESILEKKVLISVKTVQVIDGQEEKVELVTEGKYREEGDAFFAEYDESKLSGMEGTKTTLKIDKDSLSIIRNGTTNSNLMFKKGLDHISMYTTPMGTLELTIKPSKVEINMNETGGSAQLEYKMEAMGLEPISNSLELNIRQAN